MEGVGNIMNNDPVQLKHLTVNHRPKAGYTHFFLKKSWLAVLAVGALLIVSGCKPEKPDQLTIYTYSSFPAALMDNVREYFVSEHQFPVEFKAFPDTGPLFNQLLREREKPRADVVVGLDSNYFIKAVQYHLFEAYRPDYLNQIPAALQFDPDCRLLPFDFGYVLFNYDSDYLIDLPRSHQDLLKPEYRGKIIITNPLTSSPGQIFLLTTIALYGEDGYPDYWRRLKPNLLTIAPGWDEAYAMYTSGEAPIVLSYGASPVYHLLYEQTRRYRALVLEDAAYAQIESIGIIKGTPHPKQARLLVDYMLSPEFQRLIPENQFMYPARQDAALPESFQIAAQPGKILNLPPDEVAQKLEKWLTDWERIMNE